MKARRPREAKPAAAGPRTYEEVEPEASRFPRFEELAKRLIGVPKKELDEQMAGYRRKRRRDRSRG